MTGWKIAAWAITLAVWPAAIAYSAAQAAADRLCPHRRRP